MHDRTRRLLCRLIFLILCAAPTLVILAWLVVLNSSSYRAAHKQSWEDALSSRLGVVVALNDVTHPTRGTTLLSGVDLTDPETGSNIAHVRQIEIGHNGGQLIILASQPEMHGDQLWRMWETLHERILRSKWSAGWRAQFVANEVTVHQADGQSASTLTDVRCEFAPTDKGPRVTIEFRDVALQMVEPIQVRVTRNRNLQPPETSWELYTRSTALPCSLLADHIEVLAWMGDLATFQGSVEATNTSQGWDGEIVGRFQDIDLDRVVTDHYNHKLSGMADLVFRRARFSGGKLIDAAGDFVSSGGVVSKSLLDRASESLGLAADSRVSAEQVDKLQRYDHLRFGFNLNTEGLSIVGHCDAVGTGVVIADRYGPLLTDRPQEIAQVAALVRTLSSRNSQQVPATHEAYQLLHVLPIPSDSQPARLRTSDNFYSPLRLQ